jgi:hypothetical protein
VKISDSLLQRMADALGATGPAEAASTGPEVSEVIGGRYRLVRLLGVGGMGRVYEAEDARFGRVAVKVLSACDAAAQARFAREAALLVDLPHPRIVRCLDYGLHGGPTPFFVTELLDGLSLADRLRAGPLPLAEALRVLELACEPLAMLHQRGVVHRDLKPGNVFLPAGDIERLVLLDFGLARALEDDDDLTFAGSAMGTPGYMAPELQRGSPPDTRADVFALGCLLAECLTGEPAQEGAALDADRLRSLGMPEPVVALAAAMGAASPAARPDDAGAAAARVDAVLCALGVREGRSAPELAGAAEAPDWAAIEATLLRSAGGSEHAAARALADQWFDAAGIFDAGDLARRLELAGIPARAAVWYRRAARRSFERNELAALFERVEAAIRCGASRAEIGGLYLLQAQASYWQGRQADAVRHGEEAMRHLGAGSVAYLRAATEVAAAAARSGQVERAEQVAGELARALEARAPRWIVVSATRVVMALYLAGRAEAAASLCDRLEGVADLSAAGDPFVASRVAHVRSLRALFEGDLEAMAELLEVSAALVEQAGDRRAALHDRANLGFALVELGCVEQAERLLERTHADATAAGTRFTATLAKKNLAMVRLLQDRFSDAERLAAEAAVEAAENPRLCSVAHAFAAFAAVRTGAPERAALAARASYQRAPGAMERARALGATVEAELACGRLDVALQAADEAEALLGAAVPTIDGAEALVWLALIAARERAGDPDGARRLVSEARRRLRARAERIESPHLRASFLGVREHALLFHAEPRAADGGAR